MAKKYVLAVSGGVDSMVLMDALLHNRLSELTTSQIATTGTEFVVAHFDHGIRNDSSSDEKFVRGVVGDYGLTYEYERAELGAKAGEEEARNARYGFLRRCCKKYDAQLITAHHQDDLLETMIINLIRGTGWRGLASLSSDSQILRPLLHVPKSEISAYARRHNLQWREDSTNTNAEYLRNYVRLRIIPRLIKQDHEVLTKLTNINDSTHVLKNNIATELQKYIQHHALDSSQCTFARYDFIMLPPSVATELIYALLTKLNNSWHPNTFQITQALHFIKSGLAHKTMEVGAGLEIVLSKDTVQFKKV